VVKLPPSPEAAACGLLYLVLSDVSSDSRKKFTFSTRFCKFQITLVLIASVVRATFREKEENKDLLNFFSICESVFAKGMLSNWEAKL